MTPQKRTETTSPNGKTEPKFDPSTWARQPRLLARNDADSSAVMVGLVLAGIDGLLLLGWLILGRDFDGIGDWQIWQIALVLLVLEACLIATFWLWTWARSLKGDNWSARQWTWKIEQAMGIDLDRDGYNGPPMAEIEVRRQGKPPETVYIDLPPGSAPKAPILKGFGISAPDLVSFLFEADSSRGLQERNWIGKGVSPHVLPSGQEVTQPIFRQVLKALGDKRMAGKRAGRWELLVDPEVIARQLSSSPTGGSV